METSFNVDHNSLDDDSASEPEYEDYFELNENFTHLTNLIRLQYFAYLKKIINENISEWSKNQTDEQPLQLTDEEIESCVAFYEKRAVRYCMVVQLYRKYMLQTIKKIKHETSNCSLLSKLKQYSLDAVAANGGIESVSLKAKITKEEICIKSSDSNDYYDDSHYTENVQDDSYPTEMDVNDNSMTVPYNNFDYLNETCEKTSKVNGFECQNSVRPPNVDSYETLSLEQKIKLFEQSIIHPLNHENAITQKPTQKRKKSRNHHVSRKKLSISQPLSPVSTSSEDEEPPVAPPTPTPDNDHVFEDLENLFAEEKHQSSNLIDDIFGDCTNNDPAIESILREIENAKIPGCEEAEKETKELPTRRESCNSNISGGSRTRAEKKKHYRLQAITCDLRQSLWPCELYRWKRQLNETLGQLSDVSIRHHDRIRRRFDDLFGEDSDDEFGPYSPSVELDEVVIASSMKRIAPIIVKCLMYPMRDGLIGNRYLFKKLARKLAQNIVLCDQYPDEEYIKDYIDMIFAMGRRIDRIQDIEDI